MTSKNTFTRVALILSVIFVCVSPISAHAILLDRLAATVNSDLILYSDISEFRKSSALRRQLDPLFGNHEISSRIAKALDAEVVDFLIEEQLIKQEFSIGDDQVEQEIRNIQRNNNIDRNTLITALKQEGFQFSDYFELIRSSLAKRNLIDRDIRTKINVTEDDVKNFYLTNYAQSKKNVYKYKIRMITLSRTGYDTDSALKRDALEAHGKIRNGVPFADVAKEYSDHPTKTTGGDLGYLRGDELSPEIKSAIQPLKVGQNTQLLGDSKTGYLILWLEDIQTSSDSNLEKHKQEITERLMAVEYQSQIKLWIDRKRSQSFVMTVYDK